MDGLTALLPTFQKATQAVADELTSEWLPIQLGVVLALAVVSWGLGAVFRARLDLADRLMGWPATLRLLVRTLVRLLPLLIFILLAAAVRWQMQVYTWPSHSYLVGVAAKLAAAWFVIELVTSVIRNSFIKGVVSVGAIVAATLSILGLLVPTLAALDGVALNLGTFRLSLLAVIKLTLMLMIALWLAIHVGNFLDMRIRRYPDLTPSMQVLLAKLIRIALVVFAILMVAGAAGIDLSVFAFFSGAIGVGLGFGLQKIVSNLVSGIILLADKSVKPGDIISVGDSVGTVTTMGARYISVDTKDGREILIPNEDFITQKVYNWSYTSNDRQIEVRFGVNYQGDPHAVRTLAVKAASGIARVASTPAPRCHLAAFGEQTMQFALLFWIKDPANGVANVRSEVMLALWDALKAAGVEPPYRL